MPQPDNCGHPHSDGIPSARVSSAPAPGWVSRAANLAVLLLAVSVLAGWLVRLDLFGALPVGRAPMKVATALCLLLTSGACHLLLVAPRSPWRRRVGIVLAAASAAMAVLGHVPGVEPWLESSLAQASVGSLLASPDARTGPASVVASLVLSAAVLCLGADVRWSVIASQTLSLAAVTVGVVILYSQVYLAVGGGPPDTALTATALHTAVAFVVLGLVVFTARPYVGPAAVMTGNAAGAVLGRYLLATAVTVPFLLGWLRLLGQDRGFYGVSMGTTLSAAVTAAVFAVVAFLGALRVTRLEVARQRAEQALHEHTRTQVLMDNVPAVVFMKDVKGRYQLVNREFERVTGLDRARVVGLTAEDLFPAETAATMRAHDEAARAAATTVQNEELLPGLSGPRNFLTVRFSLVEEKHGASVCGVATDITERIHAAAQREQLRRRLQQTERLDALGQLAGGIAHDFNNLLASIMGRAELLHDAQPGDQLRADADAITQAAERGAALTRQLLIFSKAQPQPADAIEINPLVTAFTEALRTSLPGTIHLVTRLAPDAPACRIDPDRLEQVITHLADNARAAMPDGGRLTIETSTLLIGDDAPSDQALPAGVFLQLTVTDTGCGMPSDVAAHAFEPFFTTRPAGQGNGLGLATVYGIARQAGGDATLWSRPQGGTIVHVYLPAVDRADRQTARGVGVSDSAPGQRGSILVVDDEDDVREVVRRILSKNGFEVVCAGSGAEALRLWQDTAQVDALVTDVVMPGMSGRQLAERLRQHRPELPILYMSGYTADTFPTGQMPDHDTALIQKPFGSETLLTAVRRILDHATAERR